MRVRTYCFPGCFTRPPGTSTRNHPCQTTTSKPVVPRGFFLSVGPFYWPRGSLGGGRRTLAALTKDDTAPSHLGCSPPRRLREESQWLQSGGPRNPWASLSAARFRVEGELRWAPHGGQDPSTMKPHPPRFSACARGSAILARRCRPPSAWCCAPGAPPIARPSRKLNADPEVVRYINDGAPFTRAESDALLDAIDAHWHEHGFGLWCAAAREEPDGVPGLRRAGRALVPARGAARRRGRVASGAPGVGARARHRGGARVTAPRLRGARPGGGDLDHRPGQRALDPRRAEARHAPRGRSPAPSNGPADWSHTRFFRTMRHFHPSPLDPPESARIRSVQTRNRAAESEALGLRGPPL